MLASPEPSAASAADLSPLLRAVPGGAGGSERRGAVPRGRLVPTQRGRAARPPGLPASAWEHAASAPGRAGRGAQRWEHGGTQPIAAPQGTAPGWGPVPDTHRVRRCPVQGRELGLQQDGCPCAGRTRAGAGAVRGPGSVAPRGAEPQLCWLQPSASLVPELTGVGRGRAQPPPLPCGPPASRAPFARSGPCSPPPALALAVGSLLSLPFLLPGSLPAHGGWPGPRPAHPLPAWAMPWLGTAPQRVLVQEPEPPALGEVPAPAVVGAGVRRRPLALSPLGLSPALLVGPRGRGTPREEWHRLPWARAGPGPAPSPCPPQRRRREGDPHGVLGWRRGRGSQSRLQGGVPITSA